MAVDEQGRLAQRIEETDEDAIERRVNAFFEHLTASPPVVRYALRHLGETAAALRDIRRLPVLRADLDGGEESSAVALPLRRSIVSRALMDGATAVLRLPDSAADYMSGASKQTLRRKSRAAVRAGIMWSPVDDAGERAELLRLAQENEQSAARPSDPDSPVLDGLEGIALWLVARDRAGAPLLLSVTPADGEWAVLRYFRTLTTNEDASVARYYLTEVLVAHLVDRGVRYLADSLSPLRLTPGVRHFQRMLGYRVARVRVRRR